jgi:putative hydrolase of the HAD superfamily
VFDLGGVLAGFPGVEAMVQLAGLADNDEMWRRWLACEWVRTFERGHCDAEEFAAGVVEDWQLTVSPAEFLAEFGTWVINPYPEADALIELTAQHCTVACLSNMNLEHWDRGVSKWPLINRFDRAFISFQIGMVKPDREVYDHVVAALGTSADHVLFLDDNLINVEAARQAGLHAEVVRGVTEETVAVHAALGIS